MASFRRRVLFGGLLRNVSVTVWLESALREETDQSLLLRDCLGRLNPSWVAPEKGSQVR